MNGMKKILAGVGFILASIASVLVIYCSIDIGIDIFSALFQLLAVFSPFIGIILIIAGLLTKDN